MVTDSVADMLTQLRNAGAAQRFSVSLPHSNMLESIAKTLAEAGYVDTVSVEDEAGKPQLVVALAYHDNGTSRITRARRLSKPSRRSYVSIGEIPNVRAGVGDVVLSTPKGIMTGDKARQQHVGGEILFEIW